MDHWIYKSDLFLISFQGKELVTTSIKIISLLGDVVLALRAPDEEIISIETTGLTMTLGRHSRDKLVGLKIAAGHGRFVLPADEEALTSRITGTNFVDTQVWIAITIDPEGNSLLVFHQISIFSTKLR